MTSEFFFEGKYFIPADEAGALAGFTRDHVTRLCREGKVDGKKVGTAWYVEQDSLNAFLKRSASAATEKDYLSAADAASMIGYAKDYLLQLCRDGTLNARKMGESWFIDSKSLQTFYLEQQRLRLLRDSNLAHERRDERMHADRPDRVAARRMATLGNPVIHVAPKELAYQGVSRKSSRGSRTLVALMLVVAVVGSGYGIASAYPDRFAALPSLPHADALLASAGTAEVTVGGLSTPFLDFLKSRASAGLVALQESAGSILGASVTARNAEVTAQVVAVPAPTAPVQPTPSITNAPTIAQTILQQPVIERIRETVRTVATGAVTPDILAARLQELDNKLTGRINLVSASNNSTYQTVAQTNRIDQLTGTKLNNVTVDGVSGLKAGDIPALNYFAATSTLSLAYGGTGTSTAPSYGQMLIGNSVGSYDLVATSSLGISTSQWATSGSDIYYTIGNVGIGTTSPYAKLSVAGTVVAGLYNATSTATSTFAGPIRASCFSIDGITCITASTGSNFAYPFPSNATSTLLSFNGGLATTYASTTQIDSTGTSRLATAGGNVGIHTINPQAQLDVNGSTLIRNTLSVADTLTKAYSSFGSNSTTHALSTGADVLVSGSLEVDGTIYADGVTASFGAASTTNDFQVGGVTLLSDGTALNPAYTFTADTDTGIFRAGTNTLGFTTAGSERIRIDSAGNVGIGSTSPTALLTVGGNAYIGGSVVATGTLSVSGQTTLATSLTGLLKAAAGVVSTALVNLASDVTGVLPVANGGTGWAAVQSGTIPYGNGGSALATSSALTFDGTKLIATYASTTALTSSGSAYFATAGGSVGIGTSTPLEALSISNSASANLGVNTTNDTGYLRFVSTGSANYIQSGLSYSSASAAPLYFTDIFGSHKWMTVGSTGNVGIGSTNPQFQLQTSSNIEVGTSLDTPYGGIGRYQNLLAQSENFVTSWNTSGSITRTADTTAAPNGRTTADTLTATGAGAYDYSTTGIADSGQTFTCSVWMKTSSGTQTVGMSVVGIGLDGGDGTQFTVDSTWRRYQETRTFGAVAGNAGIIIYPGGTSGTGTVIVWGAQCEQSVSIAGIYVPTTGTSVSTSNTGLVVPDTSGSSLFFGNVGIGTTTPWSRLSVDTSNLAAGVPEFTIGSSTRNDFIVTQAGGVGIGTTNPGAPLHIFRSAAQAALDIEDNATGGTPTNSRWRLFADKVGGGGGNLTFGFYDVTNSAVRMGIDNSGNVGVGTTTPYAKLSVDSSNLGTAPAFVVGSTTKTLFKVDNGGVTSIGDSSGTGDANFQFASDINAWSVGYKSSDKSFNIASSTNFTGTAALSIAKNGNTTIVGTAVTCVIGNGSSATSCSSSDRRLKTNITSLSDQSGLDTIDALNPVSFNWNPWMQSNGSASTTQYGFIAQEVQNVLPSLVTMDQNTGYYKLDYQGFVAPSVKAIQELHLDLESIASSSATSTPQSQSFATSFFSGLFGRVSAWLADATNGVGDVFAGAFHAKQEICVDDQCLTKDDVRTLLQVAHGQVAAAGASGAMGSGSTPTSTSTPDTVAPVITLMGAASTTISVGDTYSDLGATVTDNVNNNLGYTISLDGATSTAPDQLSINTSTAATHTLLFSATDQAGNTGTASRTVNVAAPNISTATSTTP